MARQLTTEEAVSRMKAVHGDNYCYDYVSYKTARTKVEIRCNACEATFYQTPNSHLRGSGCPVCGKVKQKERAASTVKNRAGFVSPKKLTLKQVLNGFSATHGGQYDYSRVQYIDTHTTVTIICPVHGEFLQSPAAHKRGAGCPTCSARRAGDMKKLSFSEFVEKARLVHGDSYTYEEGTFVRSSHPVYITCKKHGVFSQVASEHLQGKGCQSCAHIRSVGERELLEWVRSIGVHAFNNDRSLIKPQELDIVCPDQRVAIEYNGNRWHSEQFKVSRAYHLDKRKAVSNIGWRLLSVRSDEWEGKQAIVKSILRHALGKTERSVYARKCIVRQVPKEDFKVFANKHHVQGACQITTALGLYYKDELVCCCAWVKRCGAWELVRFVVRNNTVVCGGLSRLAKAFGREFHTFCERRLFGGNGYIASGGVYAHTTQPDLAYTNGTVVMNRRRFQKKVAAKWMADYDMALTEKENAANNGWHQLWGCGLDKYVFNA